MKPIGVFGGTFDPIHFGHILPILDVCKHTGINHVRYVPNSRPGHRSQPAATAKHRWNMTQLALADYPFLHADDLEIRQSGLSYTVPTLRYFRGKFSLRPLSLILGLDAFLQIHRWYWWAEVLRLANIIVMNRPGTNWPRTMPKWFERAQVLHSGVLYQRMAGNIYIVAVSELDISASAIRKQLKSGGDVSKLMPQSVVHYISEANLYQNMRR